MVYTFNVLKYIQFYWNFPIYTAFLLFVDHMMTVIKSTASFPMHALSTSFRIRSFLLDDAVTGPWSWIKKLELTGLFYLLRRDEFWIPLSTLSNLFVVPVPTLDLNFQRLCRDLLPHNELRWEVIVPFIDTCVIVGHYCFKLPIHKVWVSQE